MSAGELQTYAIVLRSSRAVVQHVNARSELDALERFAAWRAMDVDSIRRIYRAELKR